MKVLIVDDEANTRESLCKLFALKGMQAVPARNGLFARRLLEREAFAAAVVDMCMPELDGLGLLAWMRGEGLKTPVLMMSAFGEIDDAVSAMKNGASDYVQKPFDPMALLERMRRLIAEHDGACPEDARDGAAPRVVDAAVDPPFVGESREARRIREVIRMTADSPSTVLITGESGTGKEVVARLLHRASPLYAGPFVAVNVGALPESLLESELFGYEKGAFTGASGRRSGQFELAAGGTLFLDEIGDMPLPLQVKILRVLQEFQVLRLGGAKPVPVHARIIAATNHDMERAVAERQFRSDLYYRLNVVRIHIPPLRERPDDIPLLARHLLERLNGKLGKAIRGISVPALDVLRAHPFPGNVRELENVLERACHFTTDEWIRPENIDLGSAPRLTTLHATYDESPSTLAMMERRAIQEALRRCDGNRTRAAEQLGINRRTLFNRLREYKKETADR